MMNLKDLDRSGHDRGIIQEEISENPQSELLVFRLRFKPSTSRILVKNVTATPNPFDI
jgi:hypothetical protein